MHRAYSMDWSPNSLSPTTAKLALKKKDQNIERLKEELRSEVTDRNELIEENVGLKNQIDAFQKQAHVKNLENARLKEELEDLQQELERINRLESAGNKRTTDEFARLKQDLVILRAGKEDLENENEKMSVALEKAEAKIELLRKQITEVEEMRNEWEIASHRHVEEMSKLERLCEGNRMEIADLNEYNRVLNDQLSNLESKKVNQSLTKDNEESLDREVEFQTMKEQISEMTSNIAFIEQEQSNLLIERDNLSREKSNFEIQLTELNEKFHRLCEENHVILKESIGLKKQVQQLSEESIILKNKNTVLETKAAKYHEEKLKLEKFSNDLIYKKLELEEQLVELNEKLNTVKEENCAVHQKCGRLEGEVEELLEKNSTMENKINQLSHTDLVMKDKVEELSKENINLKEQVEQLNENNTDLLDESSRLSKTNTDLIFQLEQLSKGNRDLKEEVEELIEKSMGLEKEVERLSEENIDFRSTVEKKSSEIVNCREEIEKLCVDKKNLETNLTNLECEKIQFLNEKLALESNVDQIFSEKNECDQQVQELKEKLSVLHEEILAQQKECRDVKDELEQLTIEKLGLEATVIDLKSEKVEFGKHCAKLNEEQSSLLAEKLVLQEEHEDLKQRFKELTEENLNLEASIIDLKSERIESEQKFLGLISAEKLNVEKVMNELDFQKIEFGKHVNELNGNLAASLEENLALNEACGDLKSQLEQIYQDKLNLETLVNQLNSEKGQFEEWLVELKTKLGASMEENSALYKEKKNLGNIVEQNSIENANLKMTASQLVLEKTEIEEKLNEKLAVSLKKNSELHEESKTLKETIKIISEEKTDLEFRIADLETERLSLDEKLAVSLKENSDLHEESKTLKEKIEIISKEKTDLEFRIADLETESMSLNEKLAVSLREISDLHEESKTLKEKIGIIFKEKTDLEFLVAGFEKESTSLNEKLAVSLKENSDLHEESKILTEKIEIISKEKTDLEFLIAGLERKSIDLNENLSAALEESQELRDECENLRNNITKLSEEKLDLQETVEKLQTEFVELNQEVTTLLDANGNLKLQVDNSANIISDCRHKLDFTMSEYNECREKLLSEKQSLESNLLSLSQELHSMSLQLETAIAENKIYEISIQETKRALQEKTADLVRATCYSSEVEKERNNFEKLLRDVETELKAVEATRNELQKELVSARVFIERSSEENTRNYAVLKEKLENDLLELSSVRSMYESGLSENEQLQTRIAELLELNERQSQTQDAFEKLLNEKDAELAERKIEIDRLMETASLLKEENCGVVENLRKNLVEKNGELEERKIEIDRLMETASSLKEENCGVVENLKDLEAKTVKLQTRIGELLKEKEELYEIEKLNNEAFQVQLQSVSSKNVTLSTENEKFCLSLKALQQDYEATKEKLDQTEQKLRNIEQACSKEQKKRREELDLRLLENEKREEQLLQQLETLNIKLVEETERANVLQRTHSSELKKRNEIVKSLESKSQKADERIVELKTKLEGALESNEQLMKTRIDDSKMLINENENLLVKVDDLETINERLREEQKTLSQKVDKMCEALKCKEKDIDRLRDEYEIFKEEYRKLAQHKDELEHDFKDTLLHENNKLSKKCDELSEANTKLCENVLEKDKIIENLTSKIEDLETQTNINTAPESDLNETHVVASGAENEIYMNLRRENLKLAEERESLRQKQLQLEVELEKEKEIYRTKGLKLYDKIANNLRTEYEGKLQRAKTEYQRKLSERFTAREQEWQKKESEYKTMLTKEKEHNKDLNSQNWNLMDRCLRLTQPSSSCSSTLPDNFLSPGALRKTKSATHLNVLGNRGMGMTESDRRMSSLSSMSGRASLLPESDRRLSAVSTLSEDVALPMRKKPSTISGKRFTLSSARVFPTEDEEQEIFDNACLADLKQGRIAGDESQDFSKQRLSILQARNSLCPPHLKSSYPAETQFLPAKEFKEDEIKMGYQFDDSEFETMMLGDRQRKPRNQTTYKKPGPPTPSKNASRSAAQVETPKNVLRDLNGSGTPRRRSFTPKFFNNLFSLRGHVNIPASTRDNEENIPLTPKQTRLSSIRQRFGRNHDPCRYTDILADKWGAAYYSHIWAEMLAADIRLAFTEENDNASVGARFRDTFVTFGGTCHASEVFRRFRGRDPNPDILPRYLGLVVDEVKTIENCDNNPNEDPKLVATC